MKKIVTIGLFILFASLCFAQNQVPLTVREAYDFAVGDTFQYKTFNLSTNPYARPYKQILILSTMDCIFYTFLKVLY